MLRTFIARRWLRSASPFGAQAQTIKIAILGPDGLRPGREPLGRRRNGARRDQQGGRHQRRRQAHAIELVRADTNEIASVPDATNAIERVITRDKVDFLIGGFRSEAVLAMQEVAMDYKKLFLGVGAAHSKLGLNVEQNYERYKYWFRVAPTKDVDLARTLFAVMNSIGQQIRTELKTDTPKVAILAEKAVWTEALVAAAQKNLPAHEDGSGRHLAALRHRDRRDRGALGHRPRRRAHRLHHAVGPGRHLGRPPDGRAQHEGGGLGHQRRGPEGGVLAGGGRQGAVRLHARHLLRGRDDAEDDPVRARVQGALQEGADLHRGDLRRDHAAQGGDRAGRHHQRRQAGRRDREDRARRHRRRRRAGTSATTSTGRSARPPASRCSGRTARRCRSGRRT